jgi:hypothetical protein
LEYSDFFFTGKNNVLSLLVITDTKIDFRHSRGLTPLPLGRTPTGYSMIYLGCAYALILGCLIAGKVLSRFIASPLGEEEPDPKGDEWRGYPALSPERGKGGGEGLI